MIFYTDDSKARILIPHNISELMGHTQSEQPIVLAGCTPGRKFIFTIEEITYRKSHVELTVHFLPKHGELAGEMINSPQALKSEGPMI